MTERILKLARSIVGISEGENPLLETLCRVADLAWQARLSSNVNIESCEEAFCCAAALTAAADYAVGADVDAVSEFSAGEISVHLRSGTERTLVSKALRDTAERLMAPYVKDSVFCFKGVQA